MARRWPLLFMTISGIVVAAMAEAHSLADPSWESSKKRREMSTSSTRLMDHPTILSILFHPRREFPMGFGVHDPGIEVHVPVADAVSLGGRLFVAGPHAPVILYWHGNGEIAADYTDIAPLYTRMGITLLVMDFRGYGQSDGLPTGTALLEDAIVVHEKIRDVLKHHQLPSDRLFVMGRSMGSAAAIAVARQAGASLSGLIIESGFAYSIPLMERLGGFSLDADESHGFGNHEKMAHITVPTLIIHGEEDQIIPCSDGKALFKAAASPDKRMILVPGAGHNDLMLVGQHAYFQAINTLVTETP